VRLAALWTVPLGALAVGVGCGDVYADPEADVTTGTPPPAQTDAGRPSEPPMVCPVNRPRENSPCAVPGSVCEYGSSADQDCNTLLVCRGAVPEMYWEPIYGGPCRKALCPTDTNVASLDGKPCTIEEPAEEGPVTDADEVVCSVTDGTCACTTGRDGATAHERKWVCVQPVTSCPVNRPLAGQKCVGRQWCDYGSCSFKRGVLMGCIDSTWRMGGATCR